MRTSPTRSNWVSASFASLVTVVLGVAAILPSHVEAQRWRRERLHRNLQRDGSSIREIFEPVVRPVSSSVVRITRIDRTVALGTIVGEDGWILTKASELPNHFWVVLSDGSKHDGKLVEVDETFDVALVRIDADDLDPIEWASGEPLVGQWAITPDGRTDKPGALGVVSVPPREIPEQVGMLGIRMEESSVRPRVAHVFSGSGAEAAGLRLGDVILAIKKGEDEDDTTIRTQADLRQNILKLPIGTSVEVEVQRGSFTERLTVRLGPQYGSEQEELGGDLSDYRSAFPRALQHDSAIEPRDCGSPLLDLNGRALGINIARASRTASYAIAAADVKRILRNMLPEKVGLGSQKKPATKRRAL